MKNQKLSDVAVSGLIKNNPVFRLVLGTCPTLAVTIAVMNGIGMGLSTTVVLVCSNVLISLCRNIIPDKVRMPAYIMIIATFVTLVEMFMRKYVPDLYDSLGLFIPLIVVNCIILARAESFASQNKVLPSAVDGLAMGLGFTLSLVLISAVREFFGAGQLMGVDILPEWLPKISLLVSPAGGFLVFGILMATVNFVMAKLDAKKALKEAV